MKLVLGRYGSRAPVSAACRLYISKQHTTLTCPSSGPVESSVLSAFFSHAEQPHHVAQQSSPVPSALVLVGALVVVSVDCSVVVDVTVFVVVVVVI